MKRSLDTINERILAAVKRRQPGINVSNQLPRLVAVSKLHPISAIIEAYECGQRFFGENYLQELEEKSNSPEIIKRCPDIKFHFIGHLQSNKVNRLLKVRNLHMVETVDSAKLADLINKAADRHKNGAAQSSDAEVAGATNEPLNKETDDRASDRLNVLIQVNTSGEEQKSGIQPGEAPLLAEHIFNHCRWLQLAGVMTIGRPGGWGSGPNEDFHRLYQVREMISNRLSIDSRSLELSMGMSDDFEEAIVLGSTNIRIGTAIFGERPPR